MDNFLLKLDKTIPELYKCANNEVLKEGYREALSTLIELKVWFGRIDKVLLLSQSILPNMV